MTTFYKIIGARLFDTWVLTLWETGADQEIRAGLLHNVGLSRFETRGCGQVNRGWLMPNNSGYLQSSCEINRTTIVDFFLESTDKGLYNNCCEEIVMLEVLGEEKRIGIKAQKPRMEARTTRRQSRHLGKWKGQTRTSAKAQRNCRATSKEDS